MDQNKKDKLTGYLSELPEKDVHKLTAAVELTKLKGEHDATQELILNSVRPVLAQSLNTPPRLVLPMRLFCMPFEDILYPGDIHLKERGRVSRSSLSLIWEWLSEELLPGQHEVLDESAREKLLSGDKEGAVEIVAELQSLSAQAITSALSKIKTGSDDYNRLLEKWGGTRVFEDARDIADVLHVAPIVSSLINNFPQPILSFGKYDIDSIRECYLELMKVREESAPMLFFILMGRLQEPWKVLSVIRDVTGADGEALFDDTPIGSAGSLLLEDVGKFASYFDKLTQMKVDHHDILENLAYFVQMLNGVLSEGAVKELSPTGQFLIAARSKVAEGMERILDKLPALMRSAIPSNHGNFGGRGLARPDISKWPDPEAVEHALELAILLEGTGPLASQAAFFARRIEMVDELTLLLEQYGERIVEEIRALEGEDRERAQAYSETAVLLTRYVAGEEAADLLSRRIRTASAA